MVSPVRAPRSETAWWRSWPRLSTRLDGPTEPAISFSIDALGRSKTRQVGTGTAETLHYAGTSDAVSRIGGGSSPVDAALDPAGVRLATRQSAGSPSFLLPDLHGDVAAIWSGATSAYADAFRYDPWGETIAHSPTSSARSPWRYQGRLVEGEPGDAELYDFGFRSYAADTGAFASLDDLAGGAQDVRSLNRFLYANADPATLIDPDGHKATRGGEGVGGSSSPAAIAKAKKAATDSITHPRTDSADAGSSSNPTRSVKADDWSSDATSRVIPLWLQRQQAGYPDLPYEPGCESQAFPQPCADFNGRSGYEGSCTGPDGPVSWNCAAGMLVLPVLVAAILTGGAILSEFAIMVELGGSASACLASGLCQRMQSGVQATYGAVTGEPTPVGATSLGPRLWARAETLEEHFLRHGADFGATSADEYAQMASDFLRGSQAGKLPTKIDGDGVIRVFDPSTGSFGAYNPDGTTRTFFKPTSPDYWQTQPGAAPWSP